MTPNRKVCIDCRILVSQKAKRCKDCFHKSTRGRVAWNEGLVNLPHCLKCKVQLKDYRSIKCRKCNHSHPNSLKALGDNRYKVIEMNRKNPPNLGKKWNQKSRIKLSATQQGISLEEWKGFKKSINARIRNTIEYEAWRRSVFERDNYTCQECGQIGNRLEADHIKSFAKYPELRFDINNGRTLCHNCHLKTDTWGWRTRWQKI